MCVNARTSSPEVLEIEVTVVRLSLFNFDELGQLTTIHFVPRALIQNESNKIRELLVVDHELGEDG